MGKTTHLTVMDALKTIFFFWFWFWLMALPDGATPRMADSIGNRPILFVFHWFFLPLLLLLSFLSGNFCFLFHFVHCWWMENEGHFPHNISNIYETLWNSWSSVFAFSNLCSIIFIALWKVLHWLCIYTHKYIYSTCSKNHHREWDLVDFAVWKT